MQHILALLAAVAAVQAFPQGVTTAHAPAAPAPSGCIHNHPEAFGLALVNIDQATSKAKRQVYEIVDGQLYVDGQLSVDGQITPIADGQVQADGQIQAQDPTFDPVAPVAQIDDSQIQPPFARRSEAHAPVGTIRDHQPQAAAPAQTPPVSKTTSNHQVRTKPTTMMAMSEIHDGQVQAPHVTTTMASAKAPSKTSLVTSIKSASSSTSSPVPTVACKANSTLSVTLHNGILVDNENRTGYIASNFQFQFDNPPQEGALFTSGWSACGNGSLALGGSTVFWQCLSGDFYNLYDRYWAPQCKPVEVLQVKLVDCPAA